jgi:hypothetical protein
LKTAIKIDGQPVNVPSSWHELTYGQSLRLKDATDVEAMHVLTGVELEVCQRVRPELIAAILYPSTVMSEPELIDSPLILGKEVPRKIGSMEFARKVNVDALKGDDVVGRMVAIYCADGIEDEDIRLTYELIMDEPFTHVLSAAKIISDQLILLKKSEDKIQSPEYESDELRAGIKDFSKYGTFGLVRGIALRHHCTMEDVYRWPYNSVLLELRISADENSYQRRLNRILSKKK